jgi:hypothetical protein
MNKANRETLSSCPSDMQLDALKLFSGGEDETLEAHLA